MSNGLHIHMFKCWPSETLSKRRKKYITDADAKTLQTPWHFRISLIFIMFSVFWKFQHNFVIHFWCLKGNLHKRVCLYDLVWFPTSFVKYLNCKSFKMGYIFIKITGNKLFWCSFTAVKGYKVLNNRKVRISNTVPRLFVFKTQIKSREHFP